MSQLSERAQRAARKRAAQQAELVAAARRVLAREGIGGLTIEGVAREADVSKPAVHYYFATKEALAAAVVVDVGLEEIALYEAASAKARTFAEACDACIAAFVARYEDDFASFRAHYVWSQVFRSRDPQLAVIPKQAGKLIERLEALARADVAKKRLPRTTSPRALVNVVAALAAGLLARATLLEASGAPSAVTLREVAAEARRVMARALA